MNREPRGPVRRLPLALVATGTPVLLVVLGLVLARHRLPLAVDSDVLAAVLRHRTSGQARLARLLTTLGASPVTEVCVASAGAWAAWRRRAPVRLLVVPLVLLLVGVLLRAGLAEAVRRPRPPLAARAGTAAGQAFPSGHSATAVLGWGLVAALLATTVPSRAGRIVLGSAVPLLALVVGTTRVVLGVHWVSDVLGGWAVGTALLGAALLVLRPPTPPTDGRHPPGAVALRAAGGPGRR